MILKYFSSIILCLILISTSFGQIQRETRAVWVTTNFKLDWPPNTLDVEKQKESLRDIFIDLSNKKFNTIYFQVRSNGVVLYNSKIEPFSHYLTGNIGEMPNYDPLQYAIELGKEYNIEVHAWVNMMRCFSGSDDTVLKHPNHIRNTHPDYTVRVMSENGALSYWLNPGYFRAQDYLVELLLEISNNYDIDGIHLDFFRYPDKNFEDDKYFKDYGLKVSISDWRRNNLTTILRKFNERVKPKNPYMKIGATPIGIRKSLKGAIGWEGFSSVYQDTETWLKEGLVDYLTPQIYWDIKNNPKFDILAKDWVEKSYNRHIILGLAAYKTDVKLELSEMINISRSIGSAGISFFRYANIASIDDNYFEEYAFPYDMAWKAKAYPVTKDTIESRFTEFSNNEFIIEWNDSNLDKSGKFRNYVLLQDSNPIKYLDLDKNLVKLRFGKPSKLLYKYQICKLDKLWNFHSTSNIMDINVPSLTKLKESSLLNYSPILYKISETEALLLVTSRVMQKVQLDTFNMENLRNQHEFELKMGMNILPIKENLKALRTIRISYENNTQEEVNFY